MAKRPNINGCVFCDPEPCSCGVKPKKAAAPRPRKAQPEPPPKVEPTPAAPSALDVMREKAKAAQLDRKKIVEVTVRQPLGMSSADALTLQALRALAEQFDLDGPDLDKYRDALSKPAATAERSLAWKERRRLE